jgi:alkanesulfonate monooxygenase SsuD/methylene tetrahydromethanopterin reductase-like flavin-dependent oxidoreductase (luciferase family)
MTTNVPEESHRVLEAVHWSFDTRVGFFIPAHRSTYAQLARSWEIADDIADFIVVEDHLLSFDEDDPSPQYECWALLAGMAERTSRIQFSSLVSPVAFRNPAVLGKAAVTIDHMSGGRFVFGIGGGWFAAEFERFGIPFPPYPERLAAATDAIRTCRDIWADPSLPPAPVKGAIPVLLGGDGLQRTIPAAAAVADAWNGFGPFEHWRERNVAVTSACGELGRDPRSILRTAAIHVDEIDLAPAYWEAGADLILVMVTHETPGGDLQRYVTQTSRGR